jgi:hypothetical protein
MMSLDQFKNAGVPIDRVVVGLPWYGRDPKATIVPDSVLTGLAGVLINLRYGYDYHCDADANANTTGTTCNATIGSKQGAPQVSYARAALLLANSTTGLKYNMTTVSAWFDYHCVPGPNATAEDYTGCKGAGRHQVHFDNNHTLTLKLQVRFAEASLRVSCFPSLLLQMIVFHGQIEQGCFAGAPQSRSSRGGVVEHGLR